jgi:FKBP-type peptidyl-prolyl cis-trans isomerase FklB
VKTVFSTIAFASVVALSLTTPALTTPVQAETKVDNTKAAADYGYVQGYLIGRRLRRSLAKEKTDNEAFTKGLGAALKGKSKFSDEQMQKIVKGGPVHLRAAKEKKMMENQAYLDAHKAKDGVKTTSSGLMYTIIKSGAADGKSPTGQDTVIVHYTGTLTNGTKFDSSVDRGTPATFPVGRVIPGWTEVLQLMKPGDKWAVVIPSNLGYGERGAGGLIGPNEILHFDVELIEVKK